MTAYPARLQSALLFSAVSRRAGHGDSVTVWKLDRLGRSLRDLISILDGFKGRGGAFRSLTETVDIHTPTDHAIWQVIGVIAEFERSLISERTRADVKAAKIRGVKFGRKPALPGTDRTPQEIARLKNYPRSRPQAPA